MATTITKKIQQAEVLVAAANAEYNPNFAKINSLRTFVKNLNHQAIICGETEDVKEANKLLAALPHGKSAKEKIAHMPWTEFQLWMWKTIAQKVPSALLKRQMNLKRDIFMRNASVSEKELFNQIYSKVEKL